VFSRPLTIVLLLAALPCCAELRQDIDALITAKAADETMAPAASDAEFLRRAWLDFDGGIPTAAEARAFLDDGDSEKRAKLIERLIAAPRFAERMAEAFNVMLMERRGTDPAWRQWLLDSFRANKPWDAMAREIIAPDFLDEKQRGAGYFMTRRLEKVGQQDTDYPGLTRDVGRLLMGVDLQCCQCHAHLTVRDYKQQDFAGLFVAINNTKLQPADDKRKWPWLSEGAVTTKAQFVSVLTDKKGETGPRVPFGEEVELPALSGDDAWAVKPDRKTKEIGIPKFSPLRELAQRLPSPSNPLFARNMVNRVWWLLMGRGLVEPLDLHHSANPASHPELLERLEKEFVAHHFDLRWLIRELALTESYQRASTRASSSASSTSADRYTFARERHLTSEQHLRAFLVATGEFDRVRATTKGNKNDDAKRYALADFEKAFDAALANAPKEPELQPAPSLKSALFFRNSDHVHWALQPRAGNLIDRVQSLSDPAAMAEELYLSILTRRPDPEEHATFAAWMSKPGRGRARAIGDFAWALLSSAEWFVNH
jgi:hypothetical protein